MDNNIDALTALQWQVEIGADECIGEDAIDRTIHHTVKHTTDPAMAPAREPGLPPQNKAGKPEPDPPLGAHEAIENAREAAEKAETLQDLRTAIEEFEGCALKRTATNTVFGVGPEDANIMFIGEAPGADEDRQGEPFVGSNGQLLDRMLATIGLSRKENAYITNLINWRPPGNRSPSTPEIDICLPFLYRHIELVNPEIIVLVGGMSAKTLLDRTEGITKLRGKWFDFKLADTEKTIKSIPLFHPAFLLRNPGSKALAWQDLLEIKAELTKHG